MDAGSVLPTKVLTEIWEFRFNSVTFQNIFVAKIKKGVF